MIPGLSQLGPRRRSSRQSQQEQVQQQLHPDDQRSRRQHTHHHTHHHHHHYYNRLRAASRFQPDVVDPSSHGASASATDIASSSRPAQEPPVEHDRLFRARLPSFMFRRPEYQRPETHRPESDARRVALEARGRLDERLREATLRNSDTSLPRLAQYYYNALFSDEEESFTIEDEREWEASLSEWLAGRVSGFRESWQPEWMNDLPASPIQGLSKAAVNALPREIYGQRTKWEEGVEQSDCSVCLEQFQAGQTLLCLPCKHKFHPACLTPWLEHHEQCPYCRARIHSSGTGGRGSNKDGGGMGQYDNEDNLLAWLEAFETGMARMRFNGNNTNNG